MPAVSAVSPRMDKDGWPFAKVDPFPGVDDDPLHGASHLKELYFHAQPDYAGRRVIFSHPPAILG